MLPVVGDEGEVLEIDEAVEVDVATGPGLLRGLPVVGDDGLVLDGDDAIDVGVAQVGGGEEEGVGIHGLVAEGGELEVGVVEEGEGVVSWVLGGGGAGEAFAGPGAGV